MPRERVNVSPDDDANDRLQRARARVNGRMGMNGDGGVDGGVDGELVAPGAQPTGHDHVLDLSVVRDAAGRWPKGQSGNPQGRPRNEKYGQNVDKALGYSLEVLDGLMEIFRNHPDVYARIKSGEDVLKVAGLSNSTQILTMLGEISDGGPPTIILTAADSAL